MNHTTSGTLVMSGIVHGGQQPVDLSTIQLYTVGSGGNGSAATPMLTKTVMSDVHGNFSITADYTCGTSSSNVAIGSPSNQVYIVATGGNPGLTPAVNNAALVLVAPLGNCANLPSAKFVEINEVTTAAAAWALAPFMTSATNVGATATNISGIENAFLDAALLVDTTTGLAPVNPPTNIVTETGKLYALADAIASCVNTDGGSGCTPLFTAATSAGVPTPTNTLAAALNIVKHPGKNVTAVYNTIGSAPPFPTSLTAAPNDWTMSMTVTGGGLAVPTAMGIDNSGTVWVANEAGPLSAFSPQGTPLSSTGFGAGYIGSSYGLTIDSLGDIWVTNYNASYHIPGSVTKFSGTGSGSPGTVVFNGTYPGFYDSIYYPYAVAADTNGNIFIANNGNSSATVYTSAGAVYTNADNVSGAYLGENLGLFSYPPAIAVDTTHGFWMTDDNFSVAHISGDGALLSNTTCCFGSYGVATDSAGNAWVANYYSEGTDSGSFSEISSNGTLLIDRSSVGGIQNPEFLSIDAAQNVWFANYFEGQTITEVAGGAGTLAAGTAISPSASETSAGGYGLDAGLNEPYSVLPDQSGNIWVSNEHGAKVVMFFGLATPTKTPVQPVPTAP